MAAHQLKLGGQFSQRPTPPPPEFGYVLSDLIELTLHEKVCAPQSLGPIHITYLSYNSIRANHAGLDRPVSVSWASYLEEPDLDLR
jgi:hypothetical protein